MFLCALDLLFSSFLLSESLELTAVVNRPLLIALTKYFNMKPDWPLKSYYLPKARTNYGKFNIR